MSTHSLNFYTSYNQFYIVDKGSLQDTNLFNFWTEEAFDARLAIKTGVVGVRTACYGPVKASLAILLKPATNPDFISPDHVVEGSLFVESGYLYVLDCPNMAVELELNISPGLYRIRVSSYNLNTVEGDEGNDFYQIELWPTDEENTMIIRQ